MNVGQSVSAAIENHQGNRVDFFQNRLAGTNWNNEIAMMRAQTCNI
jgi:hypothetical protein